MMTNMTFQQKDQGFLAYPQSGWRKFMFKAPIYLWRLGLSPLLGQVMVVMTHTGRKSGLPRHTMAEYHTYQGHKYVPCAFGERSQWYKNMVADPRVTIQTSQGTEQVKMVRVTDSETLMQVLNKMRLRSGPLVTWYLDSLGIEDTPQEIMTHKDRLYILRFDPTDESTPPPLKTDLIWVWPITAVLLVGLWRIKKALN